MGSRAIAAALALSLLLTACQIQTSGSTQAVGEDFGRAWLKNFMSINPKPVQNNSSGLWNWGGAPKGRVISNGMLMADPYYIWKSLNYTGGWLGEAYKDPTTGNSVYAYIDPYTGYTVYFYLDPKTGKQVYINPGHTAGSLGYGYDAYSQFGNMANGLGTV